MSEINTFRLDQRGLERYFGRLEARVMETIWELQTPSVQDVVDKLGKEANYKTIMTVMNRLAEKGFLERRKVSRAYQYSAIESRPELEQRLSHELFSGVLSDFGPNVIAQFVDVVEASDKARLVELAKLIETKLDNELEE